MSDKINNRKVFPPKKTSQDEKEVFDRIEPFVINGMIQIFGLDCPAKWELKEGTAQDKHFILFAVNTKREEVNLGEFSLLTLKQTTQAQVDNKFKAEFIRVNKLIKKMAQTTKT